MTGGGGGPGGLVPDGDGGPAASGHAGRAQVTASGVRGPTVSVADGGPTVSVAAAGLR